jgi:hypothetical protein
MLRSVKQLFGVKLGAADGDIGHVKDFYFDDRDWVVRYVVADTGTWLTGRQVLISPHAFAGIDEGGKLLPVKLTRKQIEDGPSIDLHKPVSRQYEEKYHQYYDWPFYWQGEGLWGGTMDFPGLKSPATPLTLGPAAVGSQPKRPDAHLRSAQAVNGYHFRASDVILGHVCDFMIDDKSWAIGQLAVKIGHRFTGKEVRVPVGSVDRISYDDSTVFANVTKEAVGQCPEFHEVSKDSVVPIEPAPVS